MRFGQGPLSNPLLVDAIEEHFVPVCVFNNVKEEAALLTRYKEPSWNNPVFRFFNADATEILPRKDRVWDAKGLASRLHAAITKAHGKAPAWLGLIAKELNAEALHKATFAMY